MSLKLAEICAGKQWRAMTAGFSHFPEDTLLMIIVHLSKVCGVKLDNTWDGNTQFSSSWHRPTDTDFPLFIFSFNPLPLTLHFFFYVCPNSPSLPQVTVLGRAFIPLLDDSLSFLFTSRFPAFLLRSRGHICLRESALKTERVNLIKMSPLVLSCCPWEPQSAQQVYMAGVIAFDPWSHRRLCELGQNTARKQIPPLKAFF